MNNTIFSIDSQQPGGDIYNKEKEVTFKNGEEKANRDIINLTIYINSLSSEKFSETKVQKYVKSSLEKIVPDIMGPISKDKEIEINTDKLALLDAVKEKVKDRTIRDSEILRILGNQANYRNKMNEAIDYYEKALGIDEELNDNRGIVKDLNNIGIIYFKWAKTEEAVKNHERARGIARKIGDKQGEDIALSSLSSAYQSLRKEKIPETYINYIGIKFAFVPEGGFMMGSEEDAWEKPVHKVTISKPFYLGIYPVTQREWYKVIKKNTPSLFTGDNLPIETVSWKDVQNFIQKLSEKEGTDKYRLPSEAEWEYAARAGTTTKYSFGDDESELDKYAWYCENSGSRLPNEGDYYGYDKKDWWDNNWNGKTYPVGKRNPNPWRLYDMHGNVWEWVQDKWYGNYHRAPDDGSAWEGKVSQYRVLRGGSWRHSASRCCSASRHHRPPDKKGGAVGFRLLREM